MSSDAPARSVRRRGGAGGSARQKGGLVQAPRGVPHNPWPPFQIVSAEQVEAIHSASLDGLAEHCYQPWPQRGRIRAVHTSYNTLGIEVLRG